MGRKPSHSKILEQAHMPENTNPSLERLEPLPGNSKAPLDGVDPQLENQYPPSPPLKYPNSSVDGVVLHDERNPTQEQVNANSELQEMCATLRRKKSKYNTTCVRRSQRIKSTVVHTSNHDLEPYIEDIIVSENEKDEPVAQMEKVLPERKANMSEKILEEKVDYILRRLEALEKIIESLQSKVDENIGLDETPSLASTEYRSMYIDSQKKLEALTDENRQLTGKLQNALGKVEVFEKESRVLIEVLEKMKDVVVISNLAKSTEVAVNASTQAIHNACAASAAKRKRHAQES